ncbi:MAG: Gfo/Idh/MocA family oxidoreductase, partial [Deferribacteraceae bacterium]|nr:Gfo/Idh/MocA family oxidoreductase [Deferribacteraceae bacterium]
MIKMGLIGLGKMGKHHLNLYGNIPNMKLAGICDADSEAVGSHAARLGVPGFTVFNELLPLVDAVTIAAQTKYHYEIAKACLNA